MKKGVAIISGGSSGVGETVAFKLADMGWTVYVGARRLTTGEMHGNANCIKLDVTDDKSVASAIEYVMSREGRIDALVNAAGYGLAGAVEDMTADELHSQMDVNVYGALRMTRSVLPVMRNQKCGCIVNVGSVAGFITVPFQSAYSISKYALEALNEAVAMECSRYGIRVTIVEPGDMKTGFTGNRNYTEATKDTAYRPYFDYAVHTMARDEQKGKSPEVCAKIIVKFITSKSKKARTVVGFSYKLVNIAQRLLPLKVTRSIVNMIYSSPIKDDEIWSFDRDVLKK